MKNIKEIYKFLYKAKMYILIFFFSFSLFFILYFPSDIVINLVLNKINSIDDISFTPASTELTLIPNLGFKFTRARLTVDGGKSIDISKGKIGVSLFSLISFSPKVIAQIYVFRGDINFTISGLSYFSVPDEVNLDLEIKDIMLNKNITDFIGFDFKTLVNGTINGNINIMNAMYSNLQFDLLMDKVKINKNTIMGFEVPEVNISKGVIKGNYGKGDISFDDLSIGSSSDDLMLSIRGKIKTKYQKPYDLVVNLKLAGELDTQYGSILKLGPVSQFQNAQGIYSFKMSGDMRSPMPKFESM